MLALVPAGLLTIVAVLLDVVLEGPLWIAALGIVAVMLLVLVLFLDNARRRRGY